MTPADHARARLVGRKLGLVRGLVGLPREPGATALSIAVAGAAELAVLPHAGPIDAGGGAALDGGAAWRGALFEAVERASAAVIDPRRARFDWPYHRARLHGDALPWFTERQRAAPGFPFVRVAPRARARWCEARSLVDGRPVLVPAGLVHVPFRPATEAERIGPATSTGMAAAFHPDEAALAGLLEVAERDAFMLAWLHRRSPPRLRARAGTQLARDLARSAADVTLVDVTTDLALPAVLAVARPRAGDGGPAIALGAAAKRSRSAAARRALAEALKELARLRYVAATEPAFVPTPGFENVTTFDHHARVYADPRWAPELAFLTAGDERTIDDGEALPDAPTPALAEAVRRVARAGVEPLVVDLTTRDAATLGVTVVKVLAPEAVAMSPLHRYPFLGAPRLRAGAAADLDTWALALPHPFA